LIDDGLCNLSDGVMHMRNIISYFIPFILAAILYGCATTRGILGDNTPRAEKPEGHRIEIFDSAGLHRPYKIIGTVIASTGPFHHVIDAIEHLQDEAAKMGGDALIDVVQGLPEGQEMPSGGWFIFGNTGQIWSAKVIVWENRK